jgi:hypothetical protein
MNIPLSAEVFTIVNTPRKTPSNFNYPSLVLSSIQSTLNVSCTRYFSDLLRHPSPIPVFCAAGKVDATNAQFETEEHLQRLQANGLYSKKLQAAICSRYGFRNVRHELKLIKKSDRML